MFKTIQIRRVNAVLQTRAATLWCLTGLLFFCIFYYGHYYRCGFGLADEGSAFLTAQRIAHGERPLRDLMTGYNVLWHYQIAGLFKLFGETTLVLRAYFYLLATATSLLACDAMRRVSGSILCGLFVGLWLALIPGPVHKTPIALMVVLQIWLLCRICQRAKQKPLQWKSWVAPGAGVGWCFLLRIDLGLSFMTIWLFIILLLAFICRIPEKARWWNAISSMSALLIIIASLQLIMLSISWQQDYSNEFIAQYAAYGRSILRLMAASQTTQTAQIRKFHNLGSSPTPETLVAQSSVRPTLLARETITVPKNRWCPKDSLAALTYAPILTFALIIAGLLLMLAYCDYSVRLPCFTVFASVAFSLCSFPQFFLFRPDLSHLAQFMSGFILTVVIFIAVWFVRYRKRPQICWAFILVFFIHLFAYSVVIWKHPAGGTAWSIPTRLVEYNDFKGISVLVTEHERDGFLGMKRLVDTYSKPGEYLLALPYLPGWNVLANRPTYLYSVFADDVTAGSAAWQSEMLLKLQKYHPSIFVYSDIQLNGTEQSSFSQWGRPILNYIQTHYTFRERIFDEPFYTLRKTPLPFTINSHVIQNDSTGIPAPPPEP